MEGRRASVRVLYDGVDISEEIQKYISSFAYSDNTDDAADDLQIELEDRENNWMGPWFPMFREGGDGETDDTSAERPELPPIEGNEDITTGSGTTMGPKTGSRLTAFIDVYNWDGSETVETFPCGVFEIDQMSLKGPPDVVTIKAISVPPTSTLRNQLNTRGWEDAFLSRIAADLAVENGLELRFDSSDDPFFDRIDQIETSDIAFLQDLCSQNGLSLKATGTELVIFKQSDYEKHPEVLVIHRKRSGVISYSFDQKTNDIYSEAEVYYRDPKTGKNYKGSFKDPSKEGSGLPKLIINDRPSSIG